MVPNRYFAPLALAASTLALAACGDDDSSSDPEIMFDLTTTSTVATSGSVDYVVTGLTDEQAYRITLVVADNVTVANGAGSFVDNDANGAADAGASENIARITMVNGAVVAGSGAKTVPAGSDDPASPSGVFPSDGTITLTVTGIGAGTVYPVLYENGGASTFLEIDSTGTPVETHVVGGGLTVSSSGPFATPWDPSTVAADGVVNYTVTGLDDGQAYRITLVVDGNVSVENGAGMFIDNDENGAADAGASEEVALISMVNGMAVDGGAKTVPAGTDDPANPSGIFPSGGVITVSVTGVAAGTVYPVIYENGGASTFLEIDMTGTPVETHIVAGATTVQ